MRSPRSARSGSPRSASAPTGAQLFEQAGLRALYIGDEAIVDTRAVRASRDARSARCASRSRASRRRVQHEIAELGALDEAVRRRARAGRRGLAPGRARARLQHGDGLASQPARRRDARRLRDATARARSVASSTSCRPTVEAPSRCRFMRRQHGHAERADGVHDRRGDRAPARARRRARSRSTSPPSHASSASRTGCSSASLGRLIALGDTWFQIERLYRFNAKFFPRWEPRYFMYERRFGLPRAGIAALWLEGQLPRPTLRHHHREVPG